MQNYNFVLLFFMGVKLVRSFVLVTKNTHTNNKPQNDEPD